MNFDWKKLASIRPRRLILPPAGFDARNPTDEEVERAIRSVPGHSVLPFIDSFNSTFDQNGGIGMVTPENWTEESTGHLVTFPPGGGGTWCITSDDGTLAYGHPTGITDGNAGNAQATAKIRFFDATSITTIVGCRVTNTVSLKAYTLFFQPDVGLRVFPYSGGVQGTQIGSTILPTLAGDGSVLYTVTISTVGVSPNVTVIVTCQRSGDSNWVTTGSAWSAVQQPCITATGQNQGIDGSGTTQIYLTSTLPFVARCEYFKFEALAGGLLLQERRRSA